MKKVISILVFILEICMISSCYAQEEHQLTLLQKEKDFEYLYNILKENYPYFGVGNRVDGVDWLSKKDEYLIQIKATNTDSAYLFTLKSIISEMKCGHVNLGVTQWANEGYREAHRQVADRQPHYKKWLDMFDISPDRTKYWADMLNKKEIEQSTAATREPSPARQRPNYTDTIIGQDSIAVMTVQSFSDKKRQTGNRHFFYPYKIL